jgi:hypothetical protein
VAPLRPTPRMGPAACGEYLGPDPARLMLGSCPPARQAAPPSATRSFGGVIGVLGPTEVGRGPCRGRFQQQRPYRHLIETQR